MNTRQAQNSFARRWRGEVPMRTVFWRDMFGLGTAVNVWATFVALMAASQGASSWWAATIHFAPLLYNIFVVVAVGRSSRRSGWAVMSSIAWLAVMTVV